MIYVTDHGWLEQIGLRHAQMFVPHRIAGEDPQSWLERVKDTAAGGVQDDVWTLNTAHDIVYLAELMAAEMRRHPAIVEWSSEAYATAVSGRVDVSDMCELVTEGYLSPEDRFISEFLDDLIVGTA